MNDCLILVDLQNDYFTGGQMQLVGAEQAAANAQLLLSKFREDHKPIVHIQHLAVQPGATFFLPGTYGAEINAMVAPKDGEAVVVKNYPNSFRETALLETLKKWEISNLVICGAMSHMCIDATTRAAFDHGFSCVVAEDACATKDLAFLGNTIKAADVHASFMAALSAPYAKVIATKEIINGISQR
jgi:nicotinamidase-related amidase